MGMIISLWIAEGLFAALFIVAGYPRSTKIGFAFKMAAGAIYMANGIYSFKINGTSFGVILLAALFFGLLGDIFLTLDPFIQDETNSRLKIVLPGIGGLFFLLGHAAYMFAFIQLLRTSDAFRFLPFAAAFGGVMACFILVFVLCKVKAGKFLAPIIVYMAFLAGTCALGICSALLTKDVMTVTRCIFISAPLLFAFSDVTLALQTADKKRFKTLTMRTVCLASYFLAQMLFGFLIRLV